jgi:hypothetical protein
MEWIPWHRLFGLTWMDLLWSTNAEVEMELDLSRHVQLLDVVIIRREPTPLPFALPDGFDNFGPHNLITFKSNQDTLDTWALDELVGHYVNYRKQASRDQEQLLPLDQFRLYAVCVRAPQLLQRPDVERRSEGVYSIRHFSGVIRIIVIHQLPLEQANAMMHLFSAMERCIDYAVEHYEQRSPQTSTLIQNLIEHHRREGRVVANALEEFAKRARAEIIEEATPEERLRGLPPEERLKGLPPEERLRGLPPEERLKGLPPEERLKGLPPEERLKGLPPEELIAALPLDLQEALRRGLAQGTTPPTPPPGEAPTS